jgi:hypothetical protein
VKGGETNAIIGAISSSSTTTTITTTTEVKYR